MDIHEASKELQELYNNDPIFHYCVRSGLDAEDIILAMAKRNKELSDENISLRINCTRPIIINNVEDLLNG